MNKIFAGLALAGILGAAAVSAGGQEIVEEIVAIVNDDIITLTDFKELFQMEEARIRSQQLPQEEIEKQYAVLKKEFLNLMVTEALLLQKARELNLNVSEQVKAMLEKIKQEYNMTSDAELRRAIEQQGMPYSQWIKKAEEQMMRQGVLYTEVERSIVLEDSEIVQYYKKNPAEFTMPAEYKLNAIYLAAEARTAEDCAALRTAVDAKLKEGAPFTEAAAEFADPPMKEAKGELGTFKAGELEASLESAVEKLKAGEVSAWINTKNGWYLLQVVERKDSFLRPFEEAKPQVEEKIYNQKRAAKGEEYLKTLRERSYIKILKPDPLGLDK